jgi:NAD(P)-dependent dehydrogenase (short-subunit alcohol dehydrogenase family)
MAAFITDMAGRTAVITGGASGIGLAMAHRFGAAGANVMIADIEATALERALDELHAAGITAAGTVCDVASVGAVDALADHTYERFGAAHVVCNNAGVVTFKPIWEQTLADWKWVIDIDLWGVIHGIHSFLPRMLERGEPGHFVNTASTAGILGFNGIAPYVASKHAVVGISQTMLNDLKAGKKSVGVSVLCPGGVRTGIYRSERNRPGVTSVAAPDPNREESRETIEPEDVAEMVYQAVISGTFWIMPHERYLDLYDAVPASARTRTDPPIPSVDR